MTEQKVIVLVVYPNGHAERITTRQELALARSEGLKPFMLGSADAIKAIRARQGKSHG